MMKNRANRQLTKHIALAGGLVMLFAGCQVAPPQSPELSSERMGGKAPAANTNPAQNGNGAQAPTPEVAPDAKVTGIVTDVDGKPLANVDINTYYGFSGKTDANGKFSIDVKAEEEVRLDFGKEGYLDRQMFVGVVPESAPEVNVVLKQLDTKVTEIKAAKGGTAISSDGKAVLEIPEGALKGDAKVRLTWMDPIPSDKFPESYGELPGPLVTRTMPDGSAQGENYQIPPIAFADVQLIGENLAPGAQATLRMKVNPAAMKLAEGNVDFNNPSTLQQPCYDFDRSTGLWVNPATSKLEKDSNGDVWFVYTLRGSEQAAKYKPLNHVVDTKTVYYNRTYTERYWGYKPGGGWQWLTRTVTVRESYTYNIYGNHFGGRVVEQSSNNNIDNRGVAGANVSHTSNWYGGSVTGTGGNGGFDVPMSDKARGITVTGVTWRGASWPFSQYISGQGGQLNINTNGSVSGNVTGGAAPYSASNSNLSSGNVGPGAVNLSGVSRDTTFRLNKPANDGQDPIYLVKDGQRNVTPSGTVPVKGNYNFGAILVIRDLAGQIIEESLGTWNDQQPNKPTNGAGFQGVSITQFSDSVTGASSTTTGADGKFGYSLLANANLPTLKATYLSLSATPSGQKAIDLNHTATINTDVKYTLKMGGLWGPDQLNGDMTITYKVDGVQYVKVVPAANEVKMVFVRDKADNQLKFELVKVETAGMITDAPLPTADLATGGSGEGTAKMAFKEGAVKYRH